MQVRLSALFAAAIALAPTQPVAASDVADLAASNRISPLGANLEEVQDYSSSYDFVDAMKQSREWITQNSVTGNFDTGDEACLDLDANDYVRSLTPQTSQPGCDTPDYDTVATLFSLGDFANHFPAGRYIVTYAGKATITYDLGARKNDALSRPGRDVLDVRTDGGGWILRMRDIDPANPPHDMHVWMPGYDEVTGPAQLFHPDFLNFVRANKALRFMDWMRTNGSTQKEFADRPQLQHARWTTERGVPLEIMVELANRAGTVPWFNMPHQATDDYIRQFAQMTHTLLRADLKVYVEYSNEVWNTFPQGLWVEDQGNVYGDVGSGFDRRLNWHGQRTAEMCTLWKTAFADHPERVVCVLGAQAANAYVLTQAADCPFYFATTHRHCYEYGLGAAAIAPYFGGYLDRPAVASTVRKWTLDTLFAELTTGGQLPNGPAGGALAQARNWIKPNSKEAVARGLHLVGYEGGQHLVGIKGVENDPVITALFTSANRDPRMHDVYATYLHDWRAKGGELLMHFNASGTYSKWGSWGAVEFIDQLDTPKQTAINEFVAANPCWWAGCGE